MGRGVIHALMACCSLCCSFFRLSPQSLSLFQNFDLFLWACRRFKDKKDGVEAEVDPERDQRTVFAYQVSQRFSHSYYYENSMYVYFSNSSLCVLCMPWSQMPLKATERDVYEFFTKAGKVRRAVFHTNVPNKMLGSCLLALQHHKLVVFSRGNICGRQVGQSTGELDSLMCCFGHVCMRDMWLNIYKL